MAISSTSQSVVAAPASTDFIELPVGAEFESQGYLVPSNIKPDDIYDGAPFLEPVEPVNRDSNETVDDELTRRTLGLDAASLEDRAAPRTNIYLGKVYSDYGCGMNVGSIRDFLGDGVYAICKNGHCDGGKSFTKKVRWMNNGSPSQQRWLVMTPSGAQRYGKTLSFLDLYSVSLLILDLLTPDGSAGGSPQMLGAMHNGIRALVQSKIVRYATRKYTGTWTGIGESCSMAKFPNYVSIYKDVPNRNTEPWADTAFDIRMNNNNGECLNAMFPKLCEDHTCRCEK
jgi:hypothetical protein